MNRRDFLRQTFAFSALATLGSTTALALPPDPKATHTLSFGDWGYHKSLEGQTLVSKAMSAYVAANKITPNAVLMLGDSWYGDLPGGIDSPRWRTQFEDMYPKSVLPCPFYSILGNHDYQNMPLTVNKLETELAYARRGNTRWTQPDRWYTFNLPHIKVVAIDTNVPGAHATSAVDFTLTPADYATQLTWLSAELARPRTQPFLVVMGHHPIFSNGPHGDHKTLIADVEPLFVKHGVHLYLAGHDHDLQHLEFANHPTSFVCSGAGGADLYDLKIEDSARGPYAHKLYGFTHLETTPTTLTLRHIDASGNIVHAFRKSADHTVTLA